MPEILTSTKKLRSVFRKQLTLLNKRVEYNLIHKQPIYLVGRFGLYGCIVDIWWKARSDYEESATWFYLIVWQKSRRHKPPAFWITSNFNSNKTYLYVQGCVLYDRCIARTLSHRVALNYYGIKYCLMMWSTKTLKGGIIKILHNLIRLCNIWGSTIKCNIFQYNVKK